MTPEEEARFRQAAREALLQGRDVLLVTAIAEGALEAFSVVRFEGQAAMAIVIPEAWVEIEDMEARCHGILRQESQVLTGQQLD